MQEDKCDVKLQIAGLLCYSLLILARMGIVIIMMLKGGDFGSWDGNAWSALRVLDMILITVMGSGDLNKQLKSF